MAWIQEVTFWLSEKFVYDEAGSELDRMSGLLRTGSLDERLSAVRQLTFMKAEDAAALLIGALKDPEANVRGAAASGLGYKVSVEAVAPIAVLLSDPDSVVRSKAVAALDEIGLPGARSWVHSLSTKIVSRPQDPRIPDLLARALSDFDAAVRGAALAALPRHGARGVEIVREHLLRQPDDLRAVDLAAAEPQLIAALKAREPEHRRAAVEALHRLCGARAVRALAEALRDGSPEVRRAAVEAVTALGPQPALDELLVSLRDPDVGVVKKVIEGLMAARGVSSFSATEEDRIFEELQHLVRFEGSARDAAAWALGEMGRVAAVGPLCEVLDDMREADRIAACEALGKINDPRSVGPLLKVLEAGAPEPVATAVIRSLAISQDVRAVSPLFRRLFVEISPSMERVLEEALTVLCAGADEKTRADLQSVEPATRLAAVRRVISEPRLAPALLAAALDAPNDEVRDAALDVLAKQGYDLASLARGTLLLSDKTEARRILAINLVALLRTSDAEALLDGLLGDTNEPLEVYRHAVSALKRLENPAAAEALSRHREHPQEPVRGWVTHALASAAPAES